MRINLRKTKPMKRDLVYTTDDWRLRPFDPTRVFAPSPHQNRQFAPPVEKVGLTLPGAMLGHNVDQAVRAAWLNDMFLSPDVLEWALNAVVVRSGGRTILVDAGIGGSSRTCRGPGSGPSDWRPPTSIPHP